MQDGHSMATGASNLANQQALQSCGLSLAQAKLSEFSSIVLPLDTKALGKIRPIKDCFSPFLNYHVNPVSDFHSSAIAASLIETVTGNSTDC